MNRAIHIKTTEGIYPVKISDILYFKAEKNYTYIINKSGEKILCTKNLGKFEEELKKSGFFRCHKTYVINCREIVKISNRNENKLQLSNGEEIPVAVRKRTKLLQFFEKMLEMNP